MAFGTRSFGLWKTIPWHKRLSLSLTRLWWQLDFGLIFVSIMVLFLLLLVLWLLHTRTRNNGDSGRGQDDGGRPADAGSQPLRRSRRIADNRRRVQRPSVDLSPTRLPRRSSRIAALQAQDARDAPRQRSEWKLRTKLRSFDGVSEDPLQWCRHALRVFELSSVTDEALMIQLAISSFTAAASVWADSTLGDDVVEWDTFEHQLIQRFRPSGFQNKVNSHIQQLQMHKQESVLEYSDKYRELMNLSEHHEDTYVQTWIQGLRPNIRRLVLFEAPSTFVAAVDSAERAEGAWDDDRAITLKTGVRARAPVNTSGGVPWVQARHVESCPPVLDQGQMNESVPPRRQSLVNGPNRRNEPIPPPPRPDMQPQSSRHCWACGKEGHQYRNCPHREQLSQRPHQLMARATTSKFPVADSPAFAKCMVDDTIVSSVILDPGSTHTFVDLDLAGSLGCEILKPGPLIRGINGLTDEAAGVTDKALTFQLGNQSVQLWPIIVQSRQQYQVLLGLDFLTKSGTQADFTHNVYWVGGLWIRQHQDRLEIVPKPEGITNIASAIPDSAIGARGDEELTTLTSFSETDTCELTRLRTPSSDTVYHSARTESINGSSDEVWYDIQPAMATIHVGTSPPSVTASGSSFHTAVSDLARVPRPGAVEEILIPPDPEGDDQLSLTEFMSARGSPVLSEVSVHDILRGPAVGERRDQGIDPVPGEAKSEGNGHYEDARENMFEKEDLVLENGDINGALEAAESGSESTNFETCSSWSSYHSLDDELQPEDQGLEAVDALCAFSHDFIPDHGTELDPNSPFPPYDALWERNTPVNLLKDPLSDVDINPKLPPHQKKQIRGVLQQNVDLFSDDILTFPVCRALQHEIVLVPGARPYRVKKLRRFSHKERAFIDSEIEKLLRAGFIREFDGSWCAPVTVVPKPHGGLRMCIVYCGLNRQTERLNHPIPNLPELIQQSAGYAYYSSLDAQSAFHSLMLSAPSQPLTCFTTGKGSYCFVRMPFGLMNAPMSFARAMKKVLDPVESRHCVSCFMDDCCVRSHEFDVHLKDLNATLRALRYGGLRLNISKCHFGYESVLFLGHHLSKEGRHTDNHKIEAIIQWQVPQSSSDIRRLLGMCNFYREYIARYAEIIEPLLELTRKHQSTFQWKEDQQKSFEKLKSALMNAPVLAPIDMTQPFLLECDSSQVAIASVLSQQRPVAYYSKTLSACERRYSVTDKELLSVVSSFAYFRPILHGSVTKCVTDHSSVVKLCQKEQSTGRISRWLNKLQEFTFTIEYRPGAENKKADALSRSRGPDPIPHEQDSEMTTRAIIARFSDIGDDPFLGDIQYFLETGIARGATARERRRMRDRAARFTIQNGQLLFLDRDGLMKICVPASHVRAILSEVHNECHHGRDLTIQDLKRTFWWRSIYRDTVQFIRECPVCSAFGNAKARAPLHPVLVLQPCEVIQLDYCGPLDRSDQPFLISSSCALTRFVECAPTASPSTANAITFLQERVMYRFGVPVVVLTDRGTAFSSHRFRSFLQRFNIKHRRSSAEHPQTLGNEERSHGLVVQKIRQFLVENPGASWQSQLPRAVFAVNSRVSPTAPISPLESMIGVSPRRPTELALLAKIQPTEQRIRDVAAAGRDIDFLTGRLLRLGALQDECAILKEERALKMKERYDSTYRTRPSNFEVDDLVWVRRTGRIGKLEPRWRGPAVVVRKGEDVYTIQLGETDIVCHANRLKPYYYFRQ